jgi:anhydro-N-acetylmuramic acid kinase
MQDAAATLSELTAVTVAQAIRHWGFERAHVVASGGGTRNRALMRGIARHLPQARIDTVECFGMTSESKEAIAFAVLGYETLRGRAANLPGATGARTATPLGAIAPYRLRELLNEVERECRHCT